MGKGGALNAWLREFCALVFTQTIQAFIYAIIITLIISTTNYVSNSYVDDQFINTTSMGIINIFALTSIFKIEELARKVFGIQRSSTQPESPMASMAKLAFMSHFGRRLWDNGKKFVKGGFGIAKAGRDKRKNRRKHLEAENRRGKLITKLEGDIEKLEENTNVSEVAEGKSITPTNGTAGANSIQGAMGNGNMSVSTLYINAGSVNMDGSGGQTDSEKLDKMKERLNSLLDARDSAREAYDDKVSATSKQMQDSLHMMASGLTETIGATLGGALGAVIGGADGKGLAQGTVAGMGIGDRVGQSISDIGFSAKDLIVDIKKDLKSRGKIKGLESESAGYDELVEAIKEKQKLDDKKVEDVIKQVKESTEKKKKQLGRVHDTDTEIDNM